MFDARPAGSIIFSALVSSFLLARRNYSIRLIAVDTSLIMLSKVELALVRNFASATNTQATRSACSHANISSLKNGTRVASEVSSAYYFYFTFVYLAN